MPNAPVFVRLDVTLEKILQDLAYATYAHNIRVTRDLDAIFAQCPGYLRRSHG
jgi:hypothetical protein